jgi:hypothetical protein
LREGNHDRSRDHQLASTSERLGSRLAPALIEECLDCAASRTACADACLGESDIAELRRCIRLNLDCADACEATDRIVTRQTSPDLRLIRTIAEACAVACVACAEECDRHAAHHCRVCATVCRRCKRACDELVVAIG